MALRQVSVSQRHVALDHVERGVAQDALQAEGITAVDQIRTGEGVAQGVRTAAPGDKRAIVGTCVNIRTLRAARHKENGVPFRLLKPKKETPRWKPTTL